MDFLVNDLSFHGQFNDIDSFRTAINELMDIRNAASQYNRSIYCHRNLIASSVTPSMNMGQAVNLLEHNKRISFIAWLTKSGPFWEDTRKHTKDDWFECDGTIVTDTALGEAAWCCLHGIERSLVSATPSKWAFTPTTIDWISTSNCSQSATVDNYWQSATVTKLLKNAAQTPTSWNEVRAFSIARYTNLTFSSDAFAPLEGHPFVPGAAGRILVILNILDRFTTCFDTDGIRTKEGQEMYQNFFTGKKGNGCRGSLISDSSDGDKIDFKKELTFKHPVNSGKSLFCPMHGKIQTPQLRVHFSWPVCAKKPVYIVYVGPKITKN